MTTCRAAQEIWTNHIDRTILRLIRPVLRHQKEESRTGERKAKRDLDLDKAGFADTARWFRRFSGRLAVDLGDFLVARD